MKKTLILHEPSDHGWVVYSQDEPSAAVLAETPAEAREMYLETIQSDASSRGQWRFGSVRAEAQSAVPSASHPSRLFIFASWVLGALVFIGVALLLIHHGSQYLGNPSR